MNTALVTGCAGFIGMHCAEQLLARGERVVGVDNLNAYYDVALKDARLARLMAHPHFRFERIDIADRAAVAELFARAAPDRVLHLAAQAGVRYALSKPFSYVVLIARLRALTRRVSEGALAPVMVGGLELDPVGRKVRRDGTDIALSPREYGLLEVLMRRAGETVSKRELLEQVWGQDFAGDPNVVEVYVGYLRRKIDRPFGREDLRTVRGSGYVLGEAPAARNTKPDADSDTAGA